MRCAGGLAGGGGNERGGLEEKGKGRREESSKLPIRAVITHIFVLPRTF